MASELKPCPFCNAVPELSDIWVVHPRNKCVLTEFEFGDARKTGRQNAADWNTRPTPLDPAREKLVEQWLAECTDGRVHKDTKAILRAYTHWLLAGIEADAAEIAHLHGLMSQLFDTNAEIHAKLVELEAALAERDKQIAVMREALTPTNRQQAEYMNLFCWAEPDFDECGGRTMRHVSMPWPKIKRALAAILARAGLEDSQ